jgi:hypothetical protein
MLVNYRKVRKAANNPPSPPHVEPAEETKVESIEGGEATKSESVTSEPPPSGSVTSPPRPPLRKANTVQGLSASEERSHTISPLSQSPTRDHSPPHLNEDEGNAASGEDTEDTEQPIVQLDSNPHILPGWMLRGRREYFRSLPPNAVPPRGAFSGTMTPLASDDKNPLIKRLQNIERGAISSPELANTKESAKGMFLVLKCIL